MPNTYSSLYTVELNYNLVIETEMNEKRFVRETWEYFFNCTSYAKMCLHGNEAIGVKGIIGKVCFKFKGRELNRLPHYIK